MMPPNATLSEKKRYKRAVPWGGTLICRTYIYLTKNMHLSGVNKLR